MGRLIKPPKLRPGSTVAIVAPAGPPKPDRLRKGVRALESHGYRCRVFPQVRARTGYLAGDDESRAQALMEAFADKKIDAVFCARGGYGSMRILPLLDYQVIRKNPKPIVGYSDLTAVLLAIYKKCGMVTFHGPMPAVEFGRPLKSYTVEHFFRAVESPSPNGPIRAPRGYRIGRINHGSASGHIVGGNLSLLAKMVGTGFLPSFEGKIVFFEDTEEEPYRLDGYLAQLFMATDLAKANGFLIGEFTKTETRYGHTKGWTAIEVVKDYFSRLKQPVIYNFPCGHGREKITIPIGIEVVLDADRRVLDFKEAGVK